MTLAPPTRIGPYDVASAAGGGGMPEAVLEVVDPLGGRRLIYLTKTPFLMGRAAEHVDLLLRDIRISRIAAQIEFEDGAFYLYDLGGRYGVRVNGKPIARQLLNDCESFDFGLPDSYTIIFHLDLERSPVEDLLTRLGSSSDLDPRARAVHDLNMLLEATSLVQSRLPLKDILAAVLDRAIDVTGAHRGLLLETEAGGALKPVQAREKGARSLALCDVRITDFMSASIEDAVGEQRSLSRVTTEAGEAGRAGYAQAGAGLVCMCAPLLIPSHMSTKDITCRAPSDTLLGVLYLDSPYVESTGPPIRKDLMPASDVRKSERGLQMQEGLQILDTMVLQVASVLANVRLMQNEMARRRVEQEHTIGRNIQQALLPKGLRNCSFLQVSGINRASYSVGGDYFDLMELGSKRAAFVIADVSGKGLGAALVTAMLQGTFSGLALGSDPLNVFEHANRFICDRSEVDRYATLFFGVMHSDGGLQYINAGHLPPLLIQSGMVKPALKATSVPVGMFPDAEFVSRFHKLEPGDTLVLYTDGVTDAMDPDENLFGLERLREVVARNAEAPIQAIPAAIVNAVDEFTHGGEQVDDITLLVLRYAGRA